MADEQKPKPEKQVENLELNKETLRDLTEQESERVQGGVGVQTQQPAPGRAGFVCK